MADLIRDAPIGQCIRYLSGNRVLRYPEELPGFELPLAYRRAIEIQRQGSRRTSTGSSTHEKDAGSNKSQTLADEATADSCSGRSQAIGEDHRSEKTSTGSSAREIHTDGTILVDLYTTDDSISPLNWSIAKRAFVSIVICLYTFSVSTASAVYTNSENGIKSGFGVSDQVVYLGLSLYVLGYGIGPLVLAPLSEIPSIGRNLVYILSYSVFVVLCILVAFTENFAELLVLRFLQGLAGSPCFANSGATMTDLYSQTISPYAMAIWICASYGGPAVGPILSALVVPMEGWRGPFNEILWLSAAILILFCFCPETSSSTILRGRAQRLRKLTGSEKIKSRSEIMQQHQAPKDVAISALIRPAQISFQDPAIAFANFYIALVYGTYWSFFDVFPLVYSPMYQLGSIQTGLIFLSIILSCAIGCISYSLYVRLVLNPSLKRRGEIIPEQHLLPAVFASFLLPVGLLIFGWTSRPDIHWIASVVGIVINCIGVYTIILCVSMYISCTYPGYDASLFAANGFLRAAAAAGAIHFARPMFDNLGVGWGITILAGVSTLGVVGIVFIYRYGQKLREKSKFAQS